MANGQKNTSAREELTSGAEHPTVLMVGQMRGEGPLPLPRLAERRGERMSKAFRLTLNAENVVAASCVALMTVFDAVAASCVAL